MFSSAINKNNLTEYEIRDNDYQSYIKVVPEKGGIITAFNVGGKDIFHFDEGLFTKGDTTAGGNPLLFPICSRLTGGGYELNGIKYQMPGHGFAMRMPWKVRDVKDGGTGLISLELTETEETIKMYPFRFKVIYNYILKGNELLIDQEYINYSTGRMPVHAGFHPYFAVVDKKKLKFEIDNDKYTFYGEKGREVKAYDGSVDFDRPVDHVFSMKETGGNFYRITVPELGWIVEIDTAEDFKAMVMWTVKERDFICVEPWMAIPDAMNTGKNLCWVEPGKSHKTWLKIRVREQL